MIEISYFELGSMLFLAFGVGIVYEYFASHYDYNTGEYRGKPQHPPKD